MAIHLFCVVPLMSEWLTMQCVCWVHPHIQWVNITCRFSMTMKTSWVSTQGMTLTQGVSYGARRKIRNVATGRDATTSLCLGWPTPLVSAMCGGFLTLSIKMEEVGYHLSIVLQLSCSNIICESSNMHFTKELQDRMSGTLKKCYQTGPTPTLGTN